MIHELCFNYIRFLEPFMFLKFLISPSPYKEKAFFLCLYFINQKLSSIVVWNLIVVDFPMFVCKRTIFFFLVQENYLFSWMWNEIYNEKLVEKIMNQYIKLFICLNVNKLLTSAPIHLCQNPYQLFHSDCHSITSAESLLHCIVWRLS